MTKRVEAVYENGVLRPLVPLPLVEHQHVTVTVTLDSTPPERSYLDIAFVEKTRLEISTLERIPALEEVREMLSRDKSSWAAAIVAERGDRF
jgi:predicted DNA-binding antitoxin AbrB/MazE fold protein